MDSEQCLDKSRVYPSSCYSKYKSQKPHICQTWELLDIFSHKPLAVQTYFIQIDFDSVLLHNSLNSVPE